VAAAVVDLEAVVGVLAVAVHREDGNNAFRPYDSKTVSAIVLKRKREQE
jgi:hypothetical protein